MSECLLRFLRMMLPFCMLTSSCGCRQRYLLRRCAKGRNRTSALIRLLLCGGRDAGRSSIAQPESWRHCTSASITSARSTDLVNFLFKKLWKIELSGFPGEARKWLGCIHAWQDYFDQVKFGRIRCSLKGPSQFGLISDKVNHRAFSGIHGGRKTPIMPWIYVVVAGICSIDQMLDRVAIVIEQEDDRVEITQ